MATFKGRTFFLGLFSTRIFPMKHCTGMYFCTEPTKDFSSVLLKNRGHIYVFGEDSVKFLQGLLTNDVNLFHHDSLMTAIFAIMLNTKGRVLYDLILYKQKQETPGFLIECDVQAVGSILKTLKPYKLRSKVSFNDVTDKFNSWAVVDEGAVAGLKRTEVAGHDDVILVDDPRIVSLGARLVLPKSKGAAQYFSNIKEISDEAVYDQHRVKLGVAEGVQDIEPGTPLPLEYNIAELHGVSFQKGCYVGQELTARTYHTGVIRKRLMPIKLTHTSNNEQFHIDKGTAIMTTSGKRAGKLISSYGDLGLGLMRIDVVNTGDGLTLASTNGNEVDVTVDWPTWWNLE